MRRGLHLLGADSSSASKDASSKGTSTAPSGGQTDYTPYIQAAGALAEGITQGLRSPPPQAPPPPAPPPQPQTDSNAVWYVGGAAAIAIVVALLVRSRG